MKLFKVTYKKICHPSQGLFFEDHEAYYLSESLDELYNYVENIQHLTLTTIEILECEIVTSAKPLKDESNFKTLTETTIIKAM
tara:strand:+ start:2823 stop:3071 length:249 start_codon:yes stop_codon:yes gene_type:complete